MAFFDLNIPYTESTKRNFNFNFNSNSNSSSITDKSARLKLAVKAMELGYTGVAYNHTITGTMSELDRCSISLFPISAVLKLYPSISTAVNLHRRMLDVPITTPFRQYTRLTVVVDSPAQGAALNSGNPVIKTYNIVAVKPLKQDSFEQACKNYEVDIIAIDFSENRFRLKQPLIKAAIKRGVYFEITYSGLVMDPQSRRQMISNAKLLVDWTRGKNIIFSSAAPSVTELRGPYDVANLACLLGFSLERAKASVSKTCRSLLESALRKQKFHKEAIRIELISSSEQLNGFDDWLKWDPISSGEGDLQLDDMAKSFAASGKEVKTVKAVDFTSNINELPSHGLQIKDIVSESKSVLDGSSRGSDVVTKIEKPTVVYDVPIDSKLNELLSHELQIKDILSESKSVLDGSSRGSDVVTKIEKPTVVYDVPIDSKLNVPSVNGHTLVMETLENKNLEVIASAEGGETCAMIFEEEIKIPSESNTCFSIPEAGQQNLLAEVHEAIPEENDGDQKAAANTCSALLTAKTSISFNGNIPSAFQYVEANKFTSNVPICSYIIESNEADAVLPFSDASLREEVLEEEQMRDTKDVADTLVCSSFPLSSISLIESVPEKFMRVTGEDNLVTTLRSHDELQNGANSIDNEPLEDVSMEVEENFKDDSQMKQLYPSQSSSERVGRKQGTSRRFVSFPFKRLLKPSHFKKVRKLKTKGAILSLNELIG